MHGEEEEGKEKKREERERDRGLQQSLEGVGCIPFMARKRRKTRPKAALPPEERRLSVREEEEEDALDSLVPALHATQPDPAEADAEPSPVENAPQPRSWAEKGKDHHGGPRRAPRLDIGAAAVDGQAASLENGGDDDTEEDDDGLEGNRSTGAFLPTDTHDDRVGGGGGFSRSTGLGRRRARRVLSNRAVYLALFLTLAGALLIVYGVDLLSTKHGSHVRTRAWGLVILGALLFLPGIYSARQVYGIWKGTTDDHYLTFSELV